MIFSKGSVNIKVGEPLKSASSPFLDKGKFFVDESMDFQIPFLCFRVAF